MGDEREWKAGIYRVEEDYSIQTNDTLARARTLFSEGKVSEAVDVVLQLEKTTRLGSDTKSTIKLAQEVIKMLVEVRDFDKMLEQVDSLMKKRSQMKQVQAIVVQEAYKAVELTPTLDVRIKVIQQLRNICDGKIHVELEYARLTVQLANIWDGQGKLKEACTMLQQLQVETIGNMDRHEKFEIILSQIEMCLRIEDYTVAQVLAKKIPHKALEKHDTVAHKIRYFQYLYRYYAHFENHFMMCKCLIEIYTALTQPPPPPPPAATTKTTTTKSSSTVTTTTATTSKSSSSSALPSSSSSTTGDVVMATEDAQTLGINKKDTLEALITLLLLSPYNASTEWQSSDEKSGQSSSGKGSMKGLEDTLTEPCSKSGKGGKTKKQQAIDWSSNVKLILLRKFSEDKLLKELPALWDLVNQFIAKELISWPQVMDKYKHLQNAPLFKENPSRWAILRQRVAQHNMCRVVSAYYTRISLARLAHLVNMNSVEEVEESLCEMITENLVTAKINRPAGIVDFQKSQTVDSHLNTWNDGVNQVLSLIGNVCHLIAKEQMVHKAKFTSSGSSSAPTAAATTTTSSQALELYVKQD